MVRHSFLREAPEQVDLQVNLVAEGRPRRRRATRSRSGCGPEIEALARPRGARVKVVEIPPGPPVLATMVAEVYGADRGGARPARRRGARGVPRGDGHRGRRLDAQPDRAEARRSRSIARRRRCTASRRPHVVQTLAAAGYGAPLGAFHVERGAAQVPVVLQLAPAQRARLDTLLALTVPGARGLVPLSELVRVEEDARGRRDPAQEPEAGGVRHRRPGRRDREPALRAPRAGEEARGAARRPAARRSPRYGLAHPANTERPALKWDGEWHITLEVFRDLGLAFAAVMLLIYVLMVGWFQSFTMPIVILVPIPLSLIGILPGARARRHLLHRDEHDRLHRRAPASWCATASSSWTSPS